MHPTILQIKFDIITQVWQGPFCYHRNLGANKISFVANLSTIFQIQLKTMIQKSVWKGISSFSWLIIWRLKIWNVLNKNFLHFIWMKKRYKLYNLYENKLTWFIRVEYRHWKSKSWIILLRVSETQLPNKETSCLRTKNYTS